MAEALAQHHDLGRAVRVIANGCALRRFRPASKENVVLAAGRLWDAAKNLAALDRAAARLPWRVYVAGDCRHPEQGFVAPRHAVALGPLAAADLAQRMGRAAIYALPARYEPFGLSVLEAAASGCALVLGDIPSLRELWEGAALFVDPDDDGALAAAIADLIAQPALGGHLGMRAMERAQRFPASRMAAAYGELYRELAATSMTAGAQRWASAG
jgi:glycosyltransferase involved in cell wall biosynthesis